MHDLFLDVVFLAVSNLSIMVGPIRLQPVHELNLTKMREGLYSLTHNLLDRQRKGLPIVLPSMKVHLETQRSPLSHPFWLY